MSKISQKIGVRYCSTTIDSLCVYNVYNKIFENIEKNCGQLCPKECDTVDYLITTSTAGFPSDIQLENYMKKYSHLNLTKEDLKNGILSVNIYYSELKYTEINQVLQYTFWDLVSSVGGGSFLCNMSCYFKILNQVNFIIY